MESLELARQTLTTLTPLVAQGALAKIGDNPSDQMTRLVGRAWGMLRSSVQGNPNAEYILSIYQQEPDDARNRERLAQHLADYLAQHQQAGAELQAVITQLQQPRQAGSQVGFTNSGTNTGQQAGINYGGMTQHQQNIHNAASNQGAQGTFQGPVTFNQPQSTFNQQGQNVQGNQYNANRDLIQAGGNVTQTGGDYVGGDKISGDITTGNIAGSGIAVGHKAQAQVQQGGDAEAFARAFAQVYDAINARQPDPDVDKDEITETVQAIQEEAQKGDQANEKKLHRWLGNLALMAEDIFDVTVASLAGPHAAFATVARKVAAKAKQERGQG
jgi:hypothetical protein